MSNTQRISYASFFEDKIISVFYSADRTLDDAMTIADSFRDDEWRVIDDAPYAHHTRSDLYELGLGEPALLEFILDVINCMRYNRSQEES